MVRSRRSNSRALDSRLYSRQPLVRVRMQQKIPQAVEWRWVAVVYYSR